MKSDTVEKLRKRVIVWLQVAIAAVLVAGVGLFIHIRFRVLEEAHSFLVVICFALIFLCTVLLFGLLNLAFVEFVLKKTSEGRTEIILTSATVVAADAVVLGGIYYVGSELLHIIVK